jgi:hypothetical protein
LSFLLCLCLLFIIRRLEIRAEQVLPGNEGEWGGVGERNGPNNVCTCEYMDKKE